MSGLYSAGWMVSQVVMCLGARRRSRAVSKDFHAVVLNIVLCTLAVNFEGHSGIQWHHMAAVLQAQDCKEAKQMCNKWCHCMHFYCTSKTRTVFCGMISSTYRLQIKHKKYCN